MGPASAVWKVYKSWVQSHPWLVGSGQDLLYYLAVWNPVRTNTSSQSNPEQSEAYFESAHALIGLLSVLNTSILEEAQGNRQPAATLWLDAVEQVETLVELRAIYMEHAGKMSRYGPLLILECSKALLKMHAWRHQYAGHLFLRNPGPDDLDQFESEQGLWDVLGALERLRLRYSNTDGQQGANNPWARLKRSVLGSSSGPQGQQEAPGAELQMLPLTSHLSTISSCDAGSSQPSHPSQPHAAGSSQQKAVLSQAPPQGSGLGWLGGVSKGVAPVTARQLQHQGLNLVWLGELLHIWRPVLYVSMLKRHGRTAWSPWLASLATDLVSAHLTHRGKLLLRCGSGAPPTGTSTASTPLMGQGAAKGLGVKGGHSTLLSLALARALASQPWSGGEVAELAERRKRLLLYLLRSPLLDLVTRPLAEGLAQRTLHVPLLGMGTHYLLSLLDTFTHYYCYTSGSS